MLKEVTEDFHNLRISFLKKMQISIENFYVTLKIIKKFLNKKIKWIRKKFNRFKKSLNFKKPRKNINIINYEDLNSDKQLNVEDADDDEYRKIESVRRLFEEPNRDYYKQRVIDRGFVGEVNNYIKYISEGDKDKKLSPGEYLNLTGFKRFDKQI